MAILAAAYLSLTLAAHLAGPRIITPLFPLFHKGLEWTHPEFVVQSLSVQEGKLRLEAQMTRLNPGRVGHGQRTTTFELPARQFFVGPIIVLALLLAWPHKSRRLALTAVALALPLVGLVELLDTPYAIAAIAAEQLAGPGKAPKDVEAFWWFFLDNGGRQFLSLWAAASAVLGAQLLAGKPSVPGRPARVAAWQSRRSKRRSRRREVNVESISTE